MKEASGELNMTLITIVAVAALAGLFALLWPRISNVVKNKWDQTENSTQKVCTQWNGNTCVKWG
jgi:hypothetical protein